MDIEKLSQEYIREHNNQILDDFLGFSPAQMYQIIYYPFSKECPIKISTDVKIKHLKLSSVFNISFSLLNKINESNGLKLTAKGNLPRKIIKSIYNEGFFHDKAIDKGIIKLRVESDWLILHTIHLVLKLSGIIKKYHNKLILTKKGAKFLAEGNESRLFLNLFESYTMKFNWAYNDGFEIEEIGQIGFLYLLFLVKKFGNQYKDISFYLNLYFKAFPSFLDNYLPQNPYSEKDYSKNALTLRFFERFVYWFGFIEYESDEDILYLQENVKIKKTQLLDSLLE